MIVYKLIAAAVAIDWSAATTTIAPAIVGIYHFIYHSIEQVINFTLYFFSLSFSPLRSLTDWGESERADAEIFFFSTVQTHLSTIRQTQIWNIVEKPQVTVEHFFAPTTQTAISWQKDGKKLVGHFSNWQWESERKKINRELVSLKECQNGSLTKKQHSNTECVCVHYSL